jgi:hypothetical protein
MGEKFGEGRETSVVDDVMRAYQESLNAQVASGSLSEPVAQMRAQVFEYGLGSYTQRAVEQGQALTQLRQKRMQATLVLDGTNMLTNNGQPMRYLTLRLQKKMRASMQQKQNSVAV